MCSIRRPGEIDVTGFPWHLSETPAEIRTPPPLLGEHTKPVLEELGYSDAEIERLRTERVV